MATVQPELPPVEVGVEAEEVEERVEVGLESEGVEDRVEVGVEVVLAWVWVVAEQSSAAARATMAGLGDLGSAAKMAADS
jgi:hypothetical protein